MEELIQSLPKLLRAAGEAEEVAEAAAMVAWRRVAGEALRGCAVPFRLYRKTLIVAVADTTWQLLTGRRRNAAPSNAPPICAGLPLRSATQTCAAASCSPPEVAWMLN